VGNPEVAARFRWQISGERYVQHAQYAVHRGAYFMAHIGEKIRFCLKGILELEVLRAQAITQNNQCLAQTGECDSAKTESEPLQRRVPVQCLRIKIKCAHQ
jgi:hypothetical protein